MNFNVFASLITGAVHLTGSTARISKGLCKIALSHCGITSKGVNQIAQSLTQNQSIANSLTHLDLSGNSLKDDINVRVDEIFYARLLFVFFLSELV